VYIGEMSLPSPTTVLNNIIGFIGEVVFGVILLIVTVPLVQWALMIAGILTMLLGHHRVVYLVIGAVLFVLGLVGQHVGKNLRI
jgi:hypothetical protein